MSNTVAINGREYHLGCLSRVAAPGSVFPVFGENPRRTEIYIIPRAEWQPVDWSHLVPEILDQDGQGACNAFASIQALHVLRAAVGLPFVKLSPGNLYGRINGGYDRGSLLSDAIAELEQHGVCTAALVPELDWRPSRWPAAWKDDAKRFRILEAWDCPTFDHLASAIQLGFPVNLGVLVGNNFKPGTDGWIPDYRGGGGGHAMCGVGLMRHASGDWGIKVANSWGREWGANGFGIIPESYFRATPFTDAWAVRGVVDPSGGE